MNVFPEPVAASLLVPVQPVICEPMAVSYTHLDVYKRQGEDNPNGAKQDVGIQPDRPVAHIVHIIDRTLTKTRAVPPRYLPESRQPWPNTRIPVSYTHL